MQGSRASYRVQCQLRKTYPVPVLAEFVLAGFPMSTSTAVPMARGR